MKGLSTSVVRTPFLLAGLTLLAFILRFGNLTPYLYYPDSYQNLLVARFIRTNGSVTGTLGTSGYFYPPDPAWTRPGYPLLISLAESAGMRGRDAGRMVSMALGVLSVPLAYAALTALIRSRIAGLLGAAALAASYNHTVWSAGILTESTGVFLMLLVFALLAGAAPTSAKPGIIRDYVSGIVFGFAVLTRYEYAVFAGAILLLFTGRANAVSRIATFFSAAVLTVTVAGALLTPVPAFISALAGRTRNLQVLAALGLAASAAVILFVTRVSAKTRRVTAKFAGIAVCTLGLITALSALIPDASGFLPLPNGLVRFFRHDFTVFLLSLAGLGMLAGTGTDTRLLSVTLAGLLPGVLVYFGVNPGMERYATHLLPVLLIPAGYAASVLMKLASPWRTVSAAVLVIAFAGQTVISAGGLRWIGDPSWLSESYEDRSAKIFAEQLTDQDRTLVVSLPEPYYLAAGRTTVSVYDSPPFAVTDIPGDTGTVVIVEDQPLRVIFPSFVSFLHESLADSVAFRYGVPVPFHYLSETYADTAPVTVYRIPAGELKKRAMSARTWLPVE